MRDFSECVIVIVIVIVLDFGCRLSYHEYVDLVVSGCADFHLVDLRGALLVGDRFVQFMSYRSSVHARDVHLVRLAADVEQVVPGLLRREVLFSVRRGASDPAAKLASPL